MAVCSLDYINETYTTKEAPYVASLHEQVELDFVKMGNGVIKSDRKDLMRFRPKNFHDAIPKARRIAKAVNTHYGHKVVTTQKDNRGIDYYIVNVNPLAQEDLFLQRDALLKSQKDNFKMNDEGDIIPNVPDGYEKRVKNLDGVDNTTLADYVNKIESMQEVFNSKGIDTYVMLDGDLKNPGEVLGSNNPVRKSLIESGEVNESTSVIVLNPNLAFDDVVHHEFGHIFIDVLGGMSNPIIANAFKQLENSTVYNEVKELYPELTTDSDKFKKEVVTTALGKKANEIFTENQQKSRWDRFIEWFSDKINSLLGIKKDSVTQLAKQMITGNFTQQADINVENYQRKQKLSEIADTRIRDLNKAKVAIQNNLNSAIRTYETRAGQAPLISLLEDDYFAYNFHKQPKDRITMERFNVGQMKTIQKALNDLNNVMNEEMLINYTKVAVNTINRNKRQLERIQEEFENDKSPETVQKNIKFLQSILINKNSFGLLEKLKTGLPHMGLNSEVREEMERLLNEAMQSKAETESLFKDVATEVLAEKLAGIEDLINSERKEQLELEYKNTKGQPTSEVINGETQEQFIRRKLEAEADTNRENTVDWVRRNLLASITDVGTLELFVRSEKSMNAMTVRLTSRLIDKATFERDKNFLITRDKATELFEEFNNKYGNINPKQMWGKFTQEKGNELYLISKYDIDFYNEWEQIKRAEWDALADDNLADDEKQKFTDARVKWENENTIETMGENNIPTRIPKSKWLNKNYSQIKSKPDSIEAKMLNFLEETLSSSDDAYGNRMKLGKTPYGNRHKDNAIFFRFPAISRDTIEKAVGGDYAANLKDSVERLMKYKADDTERGSLEQTEEAVTMEDAEFDPRVVKKVLASSAGNEKHNIPIMFRGNMDKKINSYDIMSAVLMDNFFANNYSEKSKIQGELEILLELTRTKDVHESSGFSNIMHAYGIDSSQLTGVLKDEGSNEYKKIQSILENRMYGITNNDTEYAKLAQTIMAWTGSVMMSLNFFSGIANVMQGKVMNFLEAHGKQHYTKEDLLIAEKKFWADSGSWINDLGRLTNRSKTRLMLDLMNVQGDFVGLNERYTRSNRGLALAQGKTLAAPNHTGEFYVQSTLMYSMMNKIKVLDKNGNYLDKDFKPTKDKSKAVSLDEAITFEKGKVNVHSSVYNTNFSDTANGDTDKILEETRAYIKKVSSDLHGQYDNDLQSHAQRSFWGKFAFMFRKWLVPGFDRRWRGTATTVGKNKIDFDFLRDEDSRNSRFFSSDMKSFQEGTYTTLIRTVQQLHKEGESLLKVITGLEGSKTWSKMTDNELSNVRKAVMELGIITASLVAGHILRGLALDLPDDSPEYTALMTSAFAFRRLHMELASFGNPLEAMQLLRSPAASISLLEKSGRLTTQLLSDLGALATGGEFERYERGNMKDQLKLKKYFFDVVPVANQTQRNVTDVSTFVFQMY